MNLSWVPSEFNMQWCCGCLDTHIIPFRGKTHTPAVASSDAGSSAAVNPESDIVLTPAKKSSEKTEKSSKKKSKVCCQCGATHFIALLTEGFSENAEEGI